jgi:hypothetical protein
MVPVCRSNSSARATTIRNSRLPWLATRDLDTARAMLGEREQIRPGYPECIGSIPPIDGVKPDPRIAAWMKGKGIDAVVWTALPAKFAGASGRAPTLEEAVAWLDSLQGAQRAKAEDYIRRTPAHIDTRYRRLIEQRLGWRPLRDAYVTQRT